jgi:tRNA threonylcarbamoyladenosine biosynthesis protein TsaE
MKNIVIENESDLHGAVKEVIAALGKMRLILLFGEMGAGKTTFVRYLMDYFGGDVASSPTYAIVNEYFTENIDFPQVYHMDLYRLVKEDEVIALPLAEYLDSGHLCIIEWPQIALPLIHDDYLNLNISVLDNGNRNLVLL